MMRSWTLGERRAVHDDVPTSILIGITYAMTTGRRSRARAITIGL